MAHDAEWWERAYYEAYEREWIDKMIREMDEQEYSADKMSEDDWYEDEDGNIVIVNKEG